ncbi:hypothetical protein B0H16DRAFT_1687665 [Mycena metata]|uniref:Uncharacterized protein n=1 Tax=Mycena metata TaxID=1033252 RepID=A0AAD7NJX6_9AGAR|nr:hypothetical protein B0H16DRAFT_1687665 [Mycena metata]
MSWRPFSSFSPISLPLVLLLGVSAPPLKPIHLHAAQPNSSQCPPSPPLHTFSFSPFWHLLESYPQRLARLQDFLKTLKASSFKVLNSASLSSIPLRQHPKLTLALQTSKYLNTLQIKTSKSDSRPEPGTIFHGDIKWRQRSEDRDKSVAYFLGNGGDRKLSAFWYPLMFRATDPTVTVTCHKIGNATGLPLPVTVASLQLGTDRVFVPALNASVAPQPTSTSSPVAQARRPVIAHIVPYTARTQASLERTTFALRPTYTTRAAAGIRPRRERVHTLTFTDPSNPHPTVASALPASLPAAAPAPAPTPPVASTLGTSTGTDATLKPTGSTHASKRPSAAATASLDSPNSPSAQSQGQTPQGSHTSPGHTSQTSLHQPLLPAMQPEPEEGALRRVAPDVIPFAGVFSGVGGWLSGFWTKGKDIDSHRTDRSSRMQRRMRTWTGPIHPSGVKELEGYEVGENLPEEFPYSLLLSRCPRALTRPPLNMFPPAARALTRFASRLDAMSRRVARFSRTLTALPGSALRRFAGFDACCRRVSAARRRVPALMRRDAFCLDAVDTL